MIDNLKRIGNNYLFECRKYKSLLYTLSSFITSNNNSLSFFIMVNNASSSSSRMAMYIFLRAFNISISFSSRLFFNFIQKRIPYAMKVNTLIVVKNMIRFIIISLPFKINVLSSQLLNEFQHFILKRCVFLIYVNC